MKKILKVFKKIIIIMLLLTLGTGIGVTAFFYPKLKTMYLDASYKVNNIKEDTFKPSQTTLVYDKDDNIIKKLKGERDTYYLEFDEISDFTKEAFISTEDKSFYTHNGIDIKGIMRAARNLVKNREISGGGSTITQQLSRNVFLTHEVSFERKIKEIFISVLLEKKHKKEDILEYYINVINFSNGTYGIEAASRKYFSKTSSELTLAETAFLCAIPNNPTFYNPLTKFDNTIKRQHRILEYMKEDGHINQEEFDKALEQKIELKVESKTKNNYVDTYVMHSATEKIMEMKGFKFQNEFKNDRERERYNESYTIANTEAQSELYSAGYRIYTSIDMKKQNALQEALDKELASFTGVNEEGVFKFQSAATTIDNTTGKVVAIVGGRTQDFSGYTLNRAYQGYRQPGSTFKPLAVYTPAFEKGYMPSNIRMDGKTADGPSNYDGFYTGPMSIREAVQQSKNTVAWDLFNEIGVNYGMSYINKMSFNKISDKDNNLSSALGGLTYGATTLEMASAYSSFSRDGYYYKPTAIVKITDSDGKVLYSDTQEPIKIYSMKASRIMNNVLTSVMTSGTGRALQLNNMVSAGKTGSTNELKDGWFAGYTPYYTTVVWSGYDKPQGTDWLFGSSYPGRIWKNYMNTIHKGLENVPFKEYEGLVKEEEAIRVEEERKVLISQIEADFEIFLNKRINTIDDVYSLEGMYNSLLERINSLPTIEEIKPYLDRLVPKKTEIDNFKLNQLPVEVPEVPVDVPVEVPAPVPEPVPIEPTPAPEVPIIPAA